MDDLDLRWEHCGLRNLVDTLLEDAPPEVAGPTLAVLKTYHDFRPTPPEQRTEET